MMSNVEIDDTQEQVLTYLKKLKHQNELAYQRLSLFAVKASDVLKYLERPEDCGRWPFDFVCQVHNSINRIAEKYLIAFPEIESQTEEDRVLSKLLTKNNFMIYGRNNFFDLVPINHFIAFMKRDHQIYSWTPDYVITVQKEVKRIKSVLF